MPAVLKAPELVRCGSHSLTLGLNSRRGFGPFDREEFYPVFELEAPRVGLVRAQFEANRYVHSEGWSEWRIFLRDVRRPATDEQPLGGELVSGVGPATRETIADRCRPLILEWLEGEAYEESRRVAAVRALVYLLDAPRGYNIDRVQRELEHARSVDLPDVDRACRLRDVLVKLGELAVELEELAAVTS